MHSLLRLSFLTLFVLGAASLLQADEVVTEPLGGVNYTFSPGSQTYVGVPILRSPLRVDVLANGILTAATLTNATNLAQDLPAGSRCFLEILGPSTTGSTTNVGARFEIDVPTTRLMANNTLAIDPVSPYTTPGRSLSDCIGCKVAIRPHWTLATFFGTGTSAGALQSGTSLKTADQVQFWTGQGMAAYWFRSNAAGTLKEWRSASASKGTANQDNTILPPGVGVVFQRSGATTMSLPAYGDVRTNAFIQVVGAGRSLLASGFPMDMSPHQANYLFASGFSSASTPAIADQIQVQTGAVKDVYWYCQETVGAERQWRNVSDGATNHSATPFLHPLRSFFVKTASAIEPFSTECPLDN